MGKRHNRKDWVAVQGFVRTGKIGVSYFSIGEEMRAKGNRLGEGGKRGYAGYLSFHADSSWGAPLDVALGRGQPPTRIVPAGQMVHTVIDDVPVFQIEKK